MKKKIRILIMFVLSFFLLTGCAQQSYFIKVNEDETVNFAIELVLKENTVEKFNQLNIQREAILETKEPLFEEFEKYFKNRGFSVTYSEENSEIKLQMQKMYPSISDFNKETKELYEAKVSGLGMSINKNSSLKGSNIVYSGELKYVFEQDFLEEIKVNPHFLEYVKDTPINSYLTIYDRDNVVGIESLETGDSGEFTTMVNGTWDMTVEQPVKTFGLKTEVKNQAFYIAMFVGISLGILLLIIVVFGKNDTLKAKIKNRIAARKDN